MISPTDSWYEPDCYDEPYVSEREEELEEDRKTTKEFLDEAIMMLYGKKPLDLEHLDFLFDELSCVYNIDKPLHLPEITGNFSLEVING